MAGLSQIFGAKFFVAGQERSVGQNNISEESLHSINEYQELDSELQIAKERYNLAAHKLRLVEDTFWQSLIARLNHVESVDYMK